MLGLYNDVLSLRIGSFMNRVRSGMKQHSVMYLMLQGVRNREGSRAHDKVCMIQFFRCLPLFYYLSCPLTILFGCKVIWMLISKLRNLNIQIQNIIQSRKRIVKTQMSNFIKDMLCDRIYLLIFYFL